MQQAAHVLDAPNEEQCFLVIFVADNCLDLAYLLASQGGVFSLKSIPWASLVAQWLRIRLPMQGTWVQALVREDPTCCEATKPMRHNY